jgi:hypothetical protein
LPDWKGSKSKIYCYNRNKTNTPYCHLGIFTTVAWQCFYLLDQFSRISIILRLFWRFISLQWTITICDLVGTEWPPDNVEFIYVPTRLNLFLMWYFLIIWDIIIEIRDSSTCRYILIDVWAYELTLWSNSLKWIKIKFYRNRLTYLVGTEWPPDNVEFIYVPTRLNLFLMWYFLIIWDICII